MYAFSTHRIWSRVVLSAVLIAGMATFTIVVSSMIMKKPVVKTRSTSQGLVRARAMSIPQLFMGGADSARFPFQLSSVDLIRKIGRPSALSSQHCDLVLELDQRQPRDALL